jgi:hypothetical protein
VGSILGDKNPRCEADWEKFLAWFADLLVNRPPPEVKVLGVECAPKAVQNDRSFVPILSARNINPTLDLVVSGIRPKSSHSESIVWDGSSTQNSTK